MSSAPADIGPALPSPAVLWSAAKEIEMLAIEAKRYSAEGPRRDVSRALKQFDSIRRLIGGNASEIRPTGGGS